MQLTDWISSFEKAKGSSAPTEYDGAFQRVLRKIRKRTTQRSKSSAELKAMLDRMLNLPLAQYSGFVQENLEMVDRRVIWMLLDEAAARVSAEPVEAEELARIAREIAERIDPNQLPPFMIFDLQCRSWVEIGRAKMVQGDLKGASFFLQGAELLRAGGSGDSTTRAHLLNAKAQLFDSRGEALLAKKARFAAGKANSEIINLSSRNEGAGRRVDSKAKERLQVELQRCKESL